MAIKGKSKSRGGKARARSAPKPVISERKPPVLARKGVRLGLVIALVVLAVLGGLRVWENLVRSSKLKKYDRALTRSQALLATHLAPDSLTSMDTNVKEFTEGKVDGKKFSDVATVWEKDFRSAKDTVAKLKPLKQLKEAQPLILQGIDGYIGIARLYQVAGTQKQIATDSLNLAKASKDAAEKKKLDALAKKDADQVQVILLHAKEWRGRADAIYNLGTGKVEALKVEWNIEKKSTSEPGSVPVGVVGLSAITPAVRKRSVA